MFGGAEESTGGNFLGRGGGGGRRSKFSNGGENPVHGRQSSSSSPAFCWKYIIEDRENPQPYSIF